MGLARVLQNKPGVLASNLRYSWLRAKTRCFLQHPCRIYSYSALLTYEVKSYWLEKQQLWEIKSYVPQQLQGLASSPPSRDGIRA